MVDEESCENQMNEREWICWLPWRKKNKGELKSAQIKFAPKREIAREEG